MYQKYPKFIESFSTVNERFNLTVDKLSSAAHKGKLFLIAPSKKVDVTRFDGDMDKLGALYWLGYNDMETRIEELREYLKAD